MLINNNTVIDLLEWKDIARQGFKSNSTCQTQFELSQTKFAVKNILKKIITKLEVCQLRVG